MEPMEPQYLSSKDVKAFPASWRSADSGDPESSLTTETSLRRLAYARFSHRSTAYFDTSSNEFVIVIDGYVFVVSPKAGVQDPWEAAIGNITEKFPDASDIYAGITVAALGMTVGTTQYKAESGLFKQLRSSKSTNNALDSAQDGALDEGEPSSLFYGLRLFDSLPLEPTGLSAYLPILHRDKGEGEEYGEWYIPEESKFVTDTNQVQNRGGGVSIGTRFDTKEVIATASGEMSSGPTEMPYSHLSPVGLEVAFSQAPGMVSRMEARADGISLSAPTDGDGGASSASLAKLAESLTISDNAKIDIYSPAVTIRDGGDNEGNRIAMSEGGPIGITGAKGITLDNSTASASDPIMAKSAAIDIQSRSVTFESDSDSNEAEVDVKGYLSVSHRGVFGAISDGSGDASVSDAIGAASLFLNGMEYKAIEVSSSDSVPYLLPTILLMRSIGDSYRSFFLVQEMPLQGVYTSSGVGGLTKLEEDGNYSQLWDLTFTLQRPAPGTLGYLAVGRLIGEWHGKAREGTVDNVLDANGFPYDASLHISFNPLDETTFEDLLGNQVRTSTIPKSTVNDWFTNG